MPEINNSALPSADSFFKENCKTRWTARRRGECSELGSSRIQFQEFCWKKRYHMAFTQPPLPHTHTTQQSIYLSKPIENWKCVLVDHIYV